MAVIFEKKNFLKVFFFKEKKYVMFKWFRFGILLEDLKEAHQRALDILLSNHCYYYIAETSEVIGTLTDPVVHWWNNEWVPVLRKSGIKAIVTVVPGNILSTLSTKDWQTSDFGGIIIKNVKTLEEAEFFLSSLN